MDQRVATVEPVSENASQSTTYDLAEAVLAAGFQELNVGKPRTRILRSDSTGMTIYVHQTLANGGSPTRWYRVVFESEDEHQRQIKLRLFDTQDGTNVMRLLSLVEMHTKRVCDTCELGDGVCSAGQGVTHPQPIDLNVDDPKLQREVCDALQGITGESTTSDGYLAFVSIVSSKVDDIMATRGSSLS